VAEFVLVNHGRKIARYGKRGLVTKPT